MPRDADGTRREFLIRLAKAAAFVPPTMASLDVRPLFAQGKGGSTTSGGKSSSTTSSTIGSISPTSQQIDRSQFDIGGSPSSTPPSAPWDTRRPSRPPPWARPPPKGS